MPRHTCRGYKQLVYGLHNNPAPTPQVSVCHHQMLCALCIISVANMGGKGFLNKIFLYPTNHGSPKVEHTKLLFL
jgi:hypothetical protein